MTREQTVDFIHSIVSLYPNWKPDNLSETVNAWAWALSDYTAKQVKAALSIYMKTSNAGFAPSAAQIIGCINKIYEKDYLTEGEAWALVKKALQNGYYGCQEEFAKLPPIIQRAVGNANMIRNWSQLDSDEVNTVIMSNFQRTYRVIVERQKFDDKVPPALAQIVRGVADNISGQKLIENG